MDIASKLNTLAEYQSQADSLEMQKRDLLDAVKIPAEVLAAQDAANRSRQAVDSAYFAAQKEINAACRAVVSDIVEPELPAEYVQAMAAYHAEVEAANSQAQFRAEQEQKRAVEAKAKIDAELQSKVADVYRQVEQRKAEIAAEFSGNIEAAQENIAKLTAEIKRDVVAEGKTVKGDYFMAVYVKGRDGGWDTAKLQGYALAHPEILTAKKPNGAPSVTIRKV